MLEIFLQTLLDFASRGIVGIILILCILVFAVVNGLIRKTFMQLWQIVVFAVLFVLSYFVFADMLSTWIYEKAMLQFGLNTTVVVENVEVYQINNFGDLISFIGALANEAKYTEEFAYNLGYSITFSMSLAILTLLDIIVAPLVTLITWPLIKLAIPKKWDHANKRWIAPLLSFVEALFGISVMINCLAAYSEGMSWLVTNPVILSRLNIDTAIFTVLRFFTTDFFGFFKVLNIHLFNFQFAANGEVYSTAKEFIALTSKVFPNVENGSVEAEALIALYKQRLLELWMSKNGVSLPPKDAIKLMIQNTLVK